MTAPAQLRLAVDPVEPQQLDLEDAIRAARERQTTTKQETGRDE